MIENPKKRPNWIRVKALNPRVRETMLSALLGLNTVCEEANCPNIGECWGRGTATFMVMGDVCTRKCSFCGVATGAPGSLNPHEPLLLAQSVQKLKLKHVVITSVNRDDLPDGGASHFVACIDELRKLEDVPTIEVLTPDFKGDEQALLKVLNAFPEVYNHNVETIPRLYREVRIGAHYEWSLLQLARAKNFAVKHPFPDFRRDKVAVEMARDSSSNEGNGKGGVNSPESSTKTGANVEAPNSFFSLLAKDDLSVSPRIIIKSGLMLGLGETLDEVVEVMMDLREAGVDLITIGQYLKPLNDRSKHEVVRYASPEEFNELAEIAKDLGFLGVASGPLIRSSYFAESQYDILAKFR